MNATSPPRAPSKAAAARRSDGLQALQSVWFGSTFSGFGALEECQDVVGSEEVREKEDSRPALQVPRFDATEPAAVTRCGDAGTAVDAGGHRYHVRLLAGFRWRLNDVELPGPPRGKAASLLKLLILQRRRPMSRNRLCSLFWPQADAESARNNLNVTLHRLRRSLGPCAHLVRCREDGWQLVFGAPVEIDVESFDAHVDEGLQAEAAGQADRAIAHYEAALSLYELDLAEAGEDEDLLMQHNQALRDRRLRAMERLAVLYEDAGDLHACLSTGLRQLEVDLCNERAHRLLMRSYARLGQPQLAERQYQQCVRSLRCALSLAPSAETTVLYRQIAARAA